MLYVYAFLITVGRKGQNLPSLTLFKKKEAFNSVALCILDHT